MTKHKDFFPLLFILLAFSIDLLTPYFIARDRIPPSLRWFSQGVIAFLIYWVLLRMMAQNKFPASFWIILLISIVEFINALFQGQGITITAWGWWLTFQFPLMAIFAFLQRDWPDNFPNMLIIGSVIILGGEVLFQIYQYLRGTPVGDQLSGTFGRNGTGNLVLFIFVVTCFAFGEWIIQQKWLPLLLTMIFGAISSGFGEMKIFLPVAVLLGVISLLIHSWRSKTIWKLLPYLLASIILVSGFFAIYNRVVPSASDYPLERYLTDPQLLDKYLNTANRYASQQSYYTDIGRNYALQYGWDQINLNPVTLLFGLGLGARSESSSLGLVGQGLAQGNLGISTGTSLLVMMQEMGLMGLTILVIFMILVVVTLFRQIQQLPTSSANGLRFGIILFTVLWPLWLWYNTAWLLRVPMLCYWVTLGYVFSNYETSLRLKSKNKNHDFKEIFPE